MLDTNHVLLNETLGGLEGLPASGRTLVEGVSRTGRTELLDDVLQAAAGDISGRIGVGTDEHGHVDGQVVSTSLLEDLSLDGLDYTDTGKLADLVVLDDSITAKAVYVGGMKVSL